MTAGELITMINLDTNEILDDSTEYIPYINAAIDYLVMILVPMKDREVVKSMDISNNNPVPGDFTAFVPAAGYPVRIVNGSFQTYGGKTVNDVFYAVKSRMYQMKLIRFHSVKSFILCLCSWSHFLSKRNL